MGEYGKKSVKMDKVIFINTCKGTDQEEENNEYNLMQKEVRENLEG